LLPLADDHRLPAHEAALRCANAKVDRLERLCESFAYRLAAMESAKPTDHLLLERLGTLEKAVDSMLRPNDIMPIYRSIQQCFGDIKTLTGQFSQLSQHATSILSRNANPAVWVSLAPVGPVAGSAETDDAATTSEGPTDTGASGCDSDHRSPDIAAACPAAPAGDEWDDFLASDASEACGPSLGDSVLVRGLARATHLNDRIGVVFGHATPDGRLAIKFASDIPAVAVRHCNLVFFVKCPSCGSEVGQRTYCPVCDFGLHTDGGPAPSIVPPSRSRPMLPS
jgi:hypothetical protein